MGKITEMLDRKDLKRRSDLRRTLEVINQNFKDFQTILNQLKEKDLSAHKRCINDLEEIQHLLLKLYKDLDDINPKF
ncbi:MAG: hypothetical protein AABW56_00370 [Nanoarchaeota archaeon]